VRQFYITPEVRRHHIGTGAFQKLKVLEFGNGANRITIDVLETNPDGKAFWNSLGFMPYAMTLVLKPES
jgi:GNAT superfamily N-acetyltransferase